MDSAWDELQTVGVPPDAIARAIDERLNIHATLAGGVQRLTQKYGNDFTARVPQTAELLAKPEWAQELQRTGDAIGVMEKAYVALRQQASQEAQADDRNEPRRVAARGLPLMEKDQERRRIEDYAHRRLRDVISDSFYK